MEHKSNLKSAALVSQLLRMIEDGLISNNSIPEEIYQPISVVSEAGKGQEMSQEEAEEGLYINASYPNPDEKDVLEHYDYVPYNMRPETYIIPVVFAIIFVVGLIGNGTVIWIYIKHRSMRSVPNMYICSLAVGDILVILFCVPFTSTVYTVESWPYGMAVCKFSEFIRDLSIGVSVFTLTALSADRYFAIVKPMQKLRRRKAKRVTCATIIGIWIVSIFFALPSMIFSFVWTVHVEDTNHTFDVCYPFPKDLTEKFAYPKVVVMFKFLVYYAIPLCFISTFYIFMARHLLWSVHNIPREAPGQRRLAKARKKLAIMILTFAGIFALCFFPSHLFLLWFYYIPNAEHHYGLWWHWIRMIGFCLSFINSCINPITMWCVSTTFRKHFKCMFRWFSCCCREKRCGYCGDLVSSHGAPIGEGNIAKPENLSQSSCSNRGDGSGDHKIEMSFTFKKHPCVEEHNIVIKVNRTGLHVHSFSHLRDVEVEATVSGSVLPERFRVCVSDPGHRDFSQR